MKKRITSIIAIILTFFIGAGGMYALIKYLPNGSKTVINKSEKEVTVTENGIADAVEKLYDAVVVVGAYTNGTLASSGTGFVYDEDNEFAYMLTNAHVIDGATSIKVKFTNSTIENVEIVGSDTYADIAVLKIKKDKVISVASIGKNEVSRVGDTVFTIGAPLDSEYSWTVTRGILSGKDRLVEVNVKSTASADWVMKVLQTDAAINSGNSGGPLANSNGEVIGITNMKLISSGVEGIGFAIPIEDAISYANKLREDGNITRPFLGISMLDTTDTYALNQYHILIDSTLIGAVVVQVQEKSPAAEAGLQTGDVITAIDDNEVNSVAKLKYYLYKHEAGDKTTIKYVRDGKTSTTTVKLVKSE